MERHVCMLERGELIKNARGIRGQKLHIFFDIDSEELVFYRATTPLFRVPLKRIFPLLLEKRCFKFGKIL